MAPTTTHQQGSAPPPFTPHPTAQAHPHARLLIPLRARRPFLLSLPPPVTVIAQWQSQHSAITAQRNHPPPVPRSSNRGTAPPPSAAKTSQPHSFLLPGGKPKTRCPPAHLCYRRSPTPVTFTPHHTPSPYPAGRPPPVPPSNRGAPPRNVVSSSHPPATQQQNIPLPAAPLPGLRPSTSQHLHQPPLALATTSTSSSCTAPPTLQLSDFPTSRQVGKRTPGAHRPFLTYPASKPHPHALTNSRTPPPAVAQPRRHSLYPPELPATLYPLLSRSLTPG